MANIELSHQGIDQAANFIGQHDTPTIAALLDPSTGPQHALDLRRWHTRTISRFIRQIKIQPIIARALNLDARRNKHHFFTRPFEIRAFINFPRPTQFRQNPRKKPNHRGLARKHSTLFDRKIKSCGTHRLKHLGLARQVAHLTTITREPRQCGDTSRHRKNDITTLKSKRNASLHTRQGSIQGQHHLKARGHEMQRPKPPRLGQFEPILKQPDAIQKFAHRQFDRRFSREATHDLFTNIGHRPIAQTLEPRFTHPPTRSIELKPFAHSRNQPHDITGIVYLRNRNPCPFGNLQGVRRLPRPQARMINDRR